MNNERRVSDAETLVCANQATMSAGLPAEQPSERNQYHSNGRLDRIARRQRLHAHGDLLFVLLCLTASAGSLLSL